MARSGLTAATAVTEATFEGLVPTTPLEHHLQGNIYICIVIDLYLVMANMD